MNTSVASLNVDSVLLNRFAYMDVNGPTAPSVAVVPCVHTHDGAPAAKNVMGARFVNTYVIVHNVKIVLRLRS